MFFFLAILGPAAGRAVGLALHRGAGREAEKFHRLLRRDGRAPPDAHHQGREAADPRRRRVPGRQAPGVGVITSKN